MEYSDGSLDNRLSWVFRERSELIRGEGPVTLKKSGFRNMMAPINVSSFFYDPLKLEDQKAVTLP